MEYMLTRWGVQYWVVYIWHGHKRLVLWVLVTTEVQCQANAQHWPQGLMSVQHPNLLALHDAPALDCPMRQELVIHRSLIGAALKGHFVLGEGEVILVLPENHRTLG